MIRVLNRSLRGPTAFPLFVADHDDEVFSQLKPDCVGFVHTDRVPGVGYRGSVALFDRSLRLLALIAEKGDGWVLLLRWKRAGNNPTPFTGEQRPNEGRLTDDGSANGWRWSAAVTWRYLHERFGGHHLEHGPTWEPHP